MRLTKIYGLVWGFLLGGTTVVFSAEAGIANTGLSNPFFAFDNGTGRGRLSFQQQAEMLRELGYDGIGFSGIQQLSEMLQSLDAQGLKMFSIYVGVCLAPEKGKPPYDPGLKAAVKQLQGRKTLIWLPLWGGKPSATNLDDRAVVILREIADMAEKTGLPVALYPHQGMYVERVEDAIRLARKVDRKNFGISFNLCHFLKVDDERNLERRLEEAMPYLFAVSINGADEGRTNQMAWDRLIQTLDRGSFDVGRVVRVLKRLNYAGPIGLQCFAIPGDCRENLVRSMAAWRKLTARVTAGVSCPVPRCQMTWPISTLSYREAI